MGKIISSLFGSLAAPKVAKKSIVATVAGKEKSKASRASLFETEGGVAGQELSSGGVQQRNTLLGN